MAPEQLAGKEVTARSDIYSLGLVLYEIFTGKRPFEANTLADLIRAQTQATPISLTTLVKDIDPAVEFTAFSVSVAGQRMRAAIAYGNKNPPHWDVLNLIEVTRYSAGTLLAQLLIRFAVQCIGGVSRDFDQIALK